MDQSKASIVADGKSRKPRKRRAQAPFGLGSRTNNLLLKSERERNLKDGFITLDDILFDYKEMLKRVEGKRGKLFKNKETGEVKTFPVCSRWNSHFNYAGKVKRRFEAECIGLREVKMMVLTVDRERVEDVMPLWWPGTSQEYMAVYGGTHVSRFLKLLRQYRESRQQRWNFIAWVMEFHNDGMVHFHLMFRGGYIAPFVAMEEMWGLGSVRYKEPERKHDGRTMIHYLTSYITKDLRRLASKEKDKDKIKKMERLAAVIWYFKKRFYNVRHGFFNEYGIRVSRVLRDSKWEVNCRGGIFQEVLALGKKVGLKTMRQIEGYIYGVKLRRAYHDENTSDYEMKEMLAMFQERLRQDGLLSC